MRRGLPDSYGLRNRVALVTGGTRGIGRAVAERLAAAGARVVVTSRHERDCVRVAATIARRHRTAALGAACDTGDPESIRALFDRVRAWRQGRVVALANVAGYPVVPRLWDTPLHRLSRREVVDAFRRVAAVDLEGSRLCTYWALRDMIPAGGGSIIYVSSTPALVGYKGLPYTEAKAALLGLMRDVARAYGKNGIRANAVAPGNIRTAWLRRVPAAERRALERENPLRRFGEPREVADAILFLLGRPSSFITGQVLVVDGGTVSH